MAKHLASVENKVREVILRNASPFSVHGQPTFLDPDPRPWYKYINAVSLTVLFPLPR
jgi:hypothetical protein